jgi:hypothetical protein
LFLLYIPLHVLTNVIIFRWLYGYAPQLLNCCTNMDPISKYNNVNIFADFRVCIRSSQYGNWLWAGWQRGQSSSPGWVRNSFFSMSSRLVLWPNQPPNQWVPGVKQPGCEADHSSPTSAKVNQKWIYTSTPPYTFMS